MSGTPEGARKARETKLSKYGADHFKVVAAKGGSAPHSEPTGYGSNRIGKDGLTGRQRLKKLWKERRRGINSSDNNPVD